MEKPLESYLVPAVFGAIFAQFGRDYPKVAGIGFAIALSMMLMLELGYLAFLPSYPLYVVIIVSVFGTTLIARWMRYNDMISPPDAADEYRPLGR